MLFRLIVFRIFWNRLAKDAEDEELAHKNGNIRQCVPFLTSILAINTTDTTMAAIVAEVPRNAPKNDATNTPPLPIVSTVIKLE